MEFTPRSLTQRAIDLELATPEQIDRIWGELRTQRCELGGRQKSAVEKRGPDEFSIRPNVHR